MPNRIRGLSMALLLDPAVVGAAKQTASNTGSRADKSGYRLFADAD
jgi:hypothetical protein